MIQLFPDQTKFVFDISEAMRSYKHCLCQAQGGFGKTYCFSWIAIKTAEKGNRILILSNRAELLIQTGGSLDKMGAKVQYISPKHRKVPTGNIVVAMAQTLRRRYEDPKWIEYLKSVDLLVIDEAHMGDFDYIFESKLFDDKWVLGFTATPKRTGKMRQLGLDYRCIVLGTKTSRLIELGRLVPARYFTLDAPDLSKVEIDSKDGDYKTSQLQAAYDTPARYGGLVSEYSKITPGTSSICFCASQIHAIQTCIELNKAGIPAKYLISGLKKDSDGYELWQDSLNFTGRREDIISEFKAGKFLILVNARILTTGFDAPNIVNVILNSATLSFTLYLQEIVRGSRPFSGKTSFTVLDFGGNYARHGSYESDKVWSLWHEVREGGGIVPQKVCPTDKKDKEGKCGCNRLIPTFYPVCPFDDCGYIFATEKEIRDIELTEIVGGKLKFSEMSAEQLVAYAELNGYAKTWAFRQMWIGGGDVGFKKGMKSLGYEWGYIYRQLKIYNSKKKI